MKHGCSIYFLNFENLICRGADISKYFRESLRDNESRLYCVPIFRIYTICGLHQAKNGLILTRGYEGQLSVSAQENVWKGVNDRRKYFMTSLHEIILPDPNQQSDAHPTEPSRPAKWSC